MSDNTQQYDYSQLYRNAVGYLEDNPTAKHAVDALILAEVAKSMMALDHLSTTHSINYSLYEKDIPITEDHVRTIVEWNVETRPRIVELPDLIESLYINSSLDAKEFSDLLDSRFPEFKMDPSSLEEVRDRMMIMNVKAAEDALEAVLEHVRSKYKIMIKDGQKTSQIEGASNDEWLDQANFYYKKFTENQFEEAQQGFYRLTFQDPAKVYNHLILYDINVELRDFARAIEELLFAVDLTKEKNLELLYKKANAIRKLGLTPALAYMDLDVIIEEFQEFAMAGNAETKRWYNELIFLIKLGMIITIARANIHVVGLAIQSPDSLENMQKLIEDQEELVKQEEYKRREEEEAEVERLEGTSLFISYRRRDSNKEVDQICNFLSTRVPHVEVFRDLTSVSPGEKFEERLEEQIMKSDVILAIIGNDWLGQVEGGGSRLGDRQDYVRRELDAALRRHDVVIIPVLVNNAVMPNFEDLPSETRALSRLQALDVKPSSFAEDMEQLVSELVPHLRAQVVNSIETVREVDEAMERTGGNLKVVFDKIFYSDPFDEVGSWECAISSTRGKGKLTFTIKGNGTFQGMWEPNGGQQFSVQGNVSKATDAKSISLSLHLDGITEDQTQFDLMIPIDRQMGEGYQGTDESGGSYFLRLIERTWGGL